MILALAFLLTAISLILLAIAPSAGVLAAFLSKPVIDLAWKSEYAVLGFRPVEIIGAVLPAILLLRILLFKADRPRPLPLIGVWSFYLLANVLAALMMLASGEGTGALSFFFRILNGFVGFYMLQAYFATRERFHVLLVVIMLACLVPMLMGLYESVTGELLRERQGVGDQVRITGLYHNSISYRIFGFMALTAIGLYWVYFAPRAKLKKLLLIFYVGVCLLVLFQVYSKAAFASFAVAIILVTIGSRRLIPGLVIVGSLIILNALTGDVVLQEIETTFSKETNALAGEIATDRALGGRIGMWKNQLSEWEQQSIENKLLGGDSGGRLAKGGGHSDYIRALKQTGVVGLFAYVLLLISVGYRVAVLFVRRRDGLSVVAAVLFWVWIIDSIGFTPALFTHYQWFVWGLIGLALQGVKGLEYRPSQLGALRPAPCRSRPTN